MALKLCLSDAHPWDTAEQFTTEPEQNGMNDCALWLGEWKP